LTPAQEEAIHKAAEMLAATFYDRPSPGELARMVLDFDTMGLLGRAKELEELRATPGVVDEVEMVIERGE
jgi:hypothetical protein